MQVELDNNNSLVKVYVTHSNLRNMFTDIRLDKHQTVSQLKFKLQTHVGTSVSFMKLNLLDQDAALVASDMQDDKMFGYYGARDGYIIHIIDLDPSSLTKEIENLESVPKYVMSDEDYDQREDTFRKFKKNILGIDQDPRSDQDLNYQKENEIYQRQILQQIQVGQRCEVQPGGRRGVVKYIGEVETLTSKHWVGVQLDEPVGKHDGQIGGKRYFTCPQNFGIFVHPDRVEVGNFPELDEFNVLGSDDEI
eukprot:TRINITY_DN1193_c0_g1_i5.p2 TRINITY_DN1193_c0_g1~~TRINITY_DN1193_c0_g1_i5.p2  ORF type:complete len:250 (-),score=11.88 TRINITY_DN1193_c0_g1_i5:244-993(-)